MVPRETSRRLRRATTRHAGLTGKGKGESAAAPPVASSLSRFSRTGINRENVCVGKAPIAAAADNRFKTDEKENWRSRRLVHSKIGNLFYVRNFF